MAAFDVQVVSADRKLFSGKCTTLVAPGIDGYFGVLFGHAPMIAALGIGRLDLTPADGSVMHIAIAGGYAEVTPDRVEILADTAEMAAEIDIERARQAIRRAEGRMREKSTDVNFDRAQAALLRAENRLRVAEAGMYHTVRDDSKP